VTTNCSLAIEKLFFLHVSRYTHSVNCKLMLKCPIEFKELTPNMTRRSILTFIFILVLFLIFPHLSCWDLRPGVTFFETFPGGEPESEIPLSNNIESFSPVPVEFEGIEIRNISRFQAEKSLSWIEHVCLNGW
jgi:hypothetical protein